ncbi:cell division septal protein FtsQ [Brevibacterium sanguinis]|uniref:Cell division septal protein FtsQ n=2 Tax=Brevibacterium TaxID=1696 RepID=A0A366IJP6_9MICO|nr:MULTISPECIES: cell division protein FtsQ [Brevibacterium]RBP64031.1 cell division septal protein FtsQ [Brevibacterium sanguinis]RBP70694.1 cell division septal protein FtsQ [Brevibacterium celere]
MPLEAPIPGENSTADLSAVIRDRRRRTWTRRLIGAGAVAAVLALAAVAWFSPVLRLEAVAVGGSRLVSADAVERFVLSRHGQTPLPQVRPGTVEAEVLDRFPRAREASVTYGGARSLRIEITDRTPVLAIAADGGYSLFDPDAVHLGTVDKAPEGLTVLEDAKGPPDRETVAAVIRFMAELSPGLRAHLRTISAVDAANLQGTIEIGEAKANVVFGDSNGASLKMETAVQLAEAGRTAIDVSVPSVPVTN